MRDYELTRRAIRDIAAARDWYHQQTFDLGNRFLDDVLIAVREATRHPKRFPLIETHVRGNRCRRFPYRIYFEERTDDLIRVLAVYHTARDPALWNDPNRP